MKGVDTKQIDINHRSSNLYTCLLWSRDFLKPDLKKLICRAKGSFVSGTSKKPDIPHWRRVARAELTAEATIRRAIIATLTEEPNFWRCL